MMKLTFATWASLLVLHNRALENSKKLVKHRMYCTFKSYQKLSQKMLSFPFVGGGGGVLSCLVK